MRTIWNAGLAAFSLAALTACVPYDDGYYAGGGYGGGYCDSFGCPNAYWDMPLYYGSVYYGGSWFNGPLYYRDWNGGRQYWVHGGWHNDGWQGARPGWWREGRTGPAMGRDFYRSDRFRNEQRANRGDGGRNGGRSGNRDNAAPQQSTPQQTNGASGRAAVGQGFQRSDAGRQDFRNRADVGNRSGDGGGNRGGGGEGGNGGGSRGDGGGGNRGGGNSGGGNGQGGGRSR